MYLKSLELHGFKSFPNKTVLTFERGTTIVVGPNGSGKSNISDAMRWVLGEISSRNIRGTRMEDVIFGGTDTRRPMSFAEVSVTFDNSDSENRIDSPYDEITVTRRYYRSGESEYMINRKNCRLRDIHELFMNTGVGREGYSIIGQGKIAEILSKKSEDRRNIFEEAAGIAKIRHRKEEAEKKLADTLKNVESVTLIFNELDARIGPLERDAEKARKYRELLEKKKCADVALWLFDTQKIKTDLQTAEQAFRLAGAEYDRLKESIESLEAQSDHIHEQLTGRRIMSEQLMSQIQDTNKRLSMLENAYQLAIGNIRHMEEMIEQSRLRFAELDQEDKRLHDANAQTQEHLDVLQKQAADISEQRLLILQAFDEAARAVLAIEKDLADELTEIEKLNAQAMDLRVRLDVCKKAKDEDAGKGLEILKEIEIYRKAEEKLNDDVARCERAAKTFKEKIDQAEQVIRETGAEVEAIKIAKDETAQKMGECKAQYSGFLQRIETLRRMEEHFEGYQQSVRFVMQEYARQSGDFRGKVFGPVSKLITVDGKYITAIETALGQSLQNIVVENEETAKSAIALLKRSGMGRATFYPLTSIRSSGATEEMKQAASFAGYIGRADQLVKFDATYRDVMEWLLLRTLVFDDIDHATEAAKRLHYKVRIVTLDGQQINAGGSFTGGSVKRDSGVLSRNTEISKLEKQAEELAKVIASYGKEIEKADQEAEAKLQKVRDAEQNRDLLYTMSRAQFSALDTANAKLDANSALLQKLQEDYDRLHSDAGKYESDIAALEQELAKVGTKLADLRELRTAQEVERQRQLDIKESKTAEISESKLQMAVLEKDIESAKAAIEMNLTTIRAHQSDREAIHARISEYEFRMQELENSKKDNRAECDVLRASLKALEDERTDAEKDSDDFDKRENELREKIRSANADRERCFAEYTRSEAKLNKLKEDNERLENRLWDEYQITYEEAVALDYPAVTAQNRHEYATVQTSCKAKIRELGSVNPNAVEEYEEVRTRHAELDKQLKDLGRAREELLEIITRVESEMRTGFMTTFEQINQNFGKVFAELFGGGVAELSLTDPEDVLTSGIEIKAAPPGKIIKSLSLLSGGEQTFVAIALIFAILQANPTPFCIFDEIEAALDEVNVDRFGAYVEQYSEHTQFIIITHRRGTMEIGNRLYGITMPERGISRAVPLDVSEIESRQKELLG